MTRKSRRSVERALSDLHETDDGTEIDEVHVVTETERGFVNIETGELVEDAEVVADFSNRRCGE
jgi:predicted transcriptional regulator